MLVMMVLLVVVVVLGWSLVVMVFEGTAGCDAAIITEVVLLLHGCLARHLPKVVAI